MAPRVLLQPPPGLEQYAPPPGLDKDAHLCASHGWCLCTGDTDLAILLNKDTFEPDPMVLAYKVDSTSKGTWGMVSTHRSRPPSTPISFWITDCYILLSTHSQCRG